MSVNVSKVTIAEGMYKYCIDNNFGSGWNEKWGEKHFKIIKDTLMDGEKIYTTFIGLHNYISLSEHDNNYVNSFSTFFIINYLEEVMASLEKAFI